MYFNYILFLVCAVYCRPDVETFFKNQRLREKGKLIFESINEDAYTKPKEIISVVYTDGKLAIQKQLVKPFIATAEFKDSVNSTGYVNFSFLFITMMDMYSYTVQNNECLM